MSAGAAQPLDATAVEHLTRELLERVSDHYHRRPTSRATAQEVLSALAIATAVIIAGARACGDEDEARGFFDLAIEQQLAQDGNPTTLGKLCKVFEP